MSVCCAISVNSHFHVRRPCTISAASDFLGVSLCLRHRNCSLVRGYCKFHRHTVSWKFSSFPRNPHAGQTYSQLVLWPRSLWRLLWLCSLLLSLWVAVLFQISYLISVYHRRLTSFRFVSIEYQWRRRYRLRSNVTNAFLCRWRVSVRRCSTRSFANWDLSSRTILTWNTPTSTEPSWVYRCATCALRQVCAFSLCANYK